MIRKSLQIVILILGVLLSPWRSYAQGPLIRKVTVQEAISLALQRNPTINQKEEELVKARLNIDRAIAVIMPKISSTFTAGHNLALMDEEQYEFSLGLQQPIYNQGKTWILRDQANINIMIAQNQLLLTKQEVLYQTLHAFYSLLKAKKVKIIALEAVDRLKEHLRVSKIRYEVGQVPETDVLRVEVELAKAEKDLIDAENTIKIAREGLNRFIDLNESFEVMEPCLFSWVIEDEASLFPKAVKDRPDIQQIRYLQQFAEKEIKIAKSAFLPSFSVMINYVRREYNHVDEKILPSQDGTQVLGEVKIPIFEGGLRVANIKEAKADYRKIEWSFEELKREIRLQIMEALLDLQKISASLKATEKQIFLAEETLRRLKLQYQEGLASNLDVIDANTFLVSANTDYSNLLYDKTVAYFKVLKTTGQLSREEIEKLYSLPKGKEKNSISQEKEKEKENSK